VVAISGPLASPEVTERRHIEIAALEIPGSKQPYHAAEKLGLKEAEQFLRRCQESSGSLAEKAIGDCIYDMNGKRQKAACCGILLGSGRPSGTLAAVLASHALIHTAEGEFFRNVISDACGHHGLQVIGVKEKELLARFEDQLHLSQQALDQHLSSTGRTLVPRGDRMRSSP
jgi:hypothetical protein